MDAVALGIKRKMDAAVLYSRRQGLKQETRVQLQVMNKCTYLNALLGC